MISEALRCLSVSPGARSAVRCLLQGLLLRPCFRQWGQVGVCTQVSAALKAQLHPSAEMQAALQLQDAAFDSLGEGVLSEACRTGSVPEPGALRARMHDAFRWIAKPAPVHDWGMTSDAESNANALRVTLEIPQAQPLKQDSLWCGVMSTANITPVLIGIREISPFLQDSCHSNCKPGRGAEAC